MHLIVCAHVVPQQPRCNRGFKARFPSLKNHLSTSFYCRSNSKNRGSVTVFENFLMGGTKCRRSIFNMRKSWWKRSSTEPKMWWEEMFWKKSQQKRCIYLVSLFESKKWWWFFLVGVVGGVPCVNSDCLMSPGNTFFISKVLTVPKT